MRPLSDPAALPEYDQESGNVVLDRYLDGAVRTVVEIRRGIEDAAIIKAVVAELRRLGFTVTPPPGRPADPVCNCPETSPEKRAGTYTVARMDLEPHAVSCPRWGTPKS